MRKIKIKTYVEAGHSLPTYQTKDAAGCEPTEVKNFGTSVTPITDIIYERYASMSPTIITSNLDSSQIRTEYNPRVADRLNEICKVLGYKNDSYRR